MGFPGCSAYTATKGAVNSITRALAVELAPNGIRVNIVVPGYVRTPMLQPHLDANEGYEEWIVGRTPLGRIGRPGRGRAEHPLHALAALAVRRRRHAWSPTVAGLPNRAIALVPPTLLPEPRAPVPRWSGGADLRSRLRVPRFSAIWVATAVLFAVSPLLAQGSVSQSALLSMLPFAAILAIAGIGQTLVIQQRGLDLSVPGMITLTSILVTRIPNGHDDRLPEAMGVVLLACIASGLISGIAVTWLSITPLVATLGVNALLQGVVFQITSGASTSAAPPTWRASRSTRRRRAERRADRRRRDPGRRRHHPLDDRRAALRRRRREPGRGARRRRARQGYEVATYVFASITYGAAGILVAGFLGTPGIGAGNDYLLPTIAAVVLGGTSLVGGVGSVVATGIGALFLTQLEQVVLGMGAPASVQFVIQGSIIAIGMAVGAVHWRRGVCAISRGRATAGTPSASLLTRQQSGLLTPSRARRLPRRTRATSRATTL